jgi:hypothetical protein
MKLPVQIHESHINRVRKWATGPLPFVLVLDSMPPEQRFHGIVNRIAPLPDSQSRWGNPAI